MLRQFHSARIALAVVLLLGAAVPAWAITVTSTGSGNWGAAIWTPSPPAFGDDVIIAAGHTVTLNVNPPDLGSLTVNGTLQRPSDASNYQLYVLGNITVAVGGSINFSAGTGVVTVTCDGSVTNNSASASALNLTRCPLTVGGTLNNNAGTITTTTGNVTVTGLYTNASGATHNHTGAGVVQFNGGFTNSGIYAHSGTGALTIGGTGLNNAVAGASFTCAAASLTINGGLQNSANTCTYSAAGPFNITGNVTNSGTFTISGAANVTVDPNFTNTGTVNFSYNPGAAASCSLYVVGDLNNNAGSFTLNHHGLRVGGNLTNGGTFTKAGTNNFIRPMRVLGKLVNNSKFYVTTTSTIYNLYVGDTLRNEDSINVAGATTRNDTVGSLVNNKSIVYGAQGLVVWREAGEANFANSVATSRFNRTGNGLTEVKDNHTNAGLDTIQGTGAFTVGGVLNNSGRFRATNTGAYTADVNAGQLINSNSFVLAGTHGLNVTGNVTNAGTFSRSAGTNARPIRVGGDWSNAGGSSLYVLATNTASRFVVLGTLTNNADTMHITGAGSTYYDTIGTLVNNRVLNYVAANLQVNNNFTNGTGTAGRFRHTGGGAIRVTGNLTNNDTLLFTATSGRLVVLGTRTNNDYDTLVGANNRWDTAGTLVNNGRIVYNFQQLQVLDGGFTNNAGCTYLRLGGTNTTNMTRVDGDLTNHGDLLFRSAAGGRFVVLGTFTNSATGYDSMVGAGQWDTVGVLVNNNRIVYGNQWLQVLTSFTNAGVYQRLATTNLTRVGDAAQGTGDVLNNGKLLFNINAGRFCAFGTVTNNDSIYVNGVTTSTDTFGNLINNKNLIYTNQSIWVRGDFTNNAPDGVHKRTAPAAATMLVEGNLTNHRILDLSNMTSWLRVRGTLTNNDSLCHTANVTDSVTTRFVNGPSARAWLPLANLWTGPNGDMENHGLFWKNTGSVIVGDTYINTGIDSIRGSTTRNVGTLVNSGTICQRVNAATTFTVSGNCQNSGFFDNRGSQLALTVGGDFTNTGIYRDSAQCVLTVGGHLNNGPTGVIDKYPTSLGTYWHRRNFNGSVTNQNSTPGAFDLTWAYVYFGGNNPGTVTSVTELVCDSVRVEKGDAATTLTFNNTGLRIPVNNLTIARGTMIMNGGSLWVDNSGANVGRVQGLQGAGLTMQGRLQIQGGCQADIRWLDQKNLTGVSRFVVDGAGTVVNIDSIHELNALSPLPAPVCSILGGAVHYKGSGTVANSSLYIIQNGTEGGGWYATGGDVYFYGNIYCTGPTNFVAGSGAALHFVGNKSSTVTMTTGPIIGVTNWSLGTLLVEKQSPQNLFLTSTASLGDNYVQTADVYVIFGATLSLGGTFSSSAYGYRINGSIQNDGVISIGGTPNYGIYVSGNWIGIGSYTHGQRPVTFDGPGNATLNVGASSPFYNLTVTKPSGSLTLGSNLQVHNQLQVTNGTLNLASKTLTLGTNSAAGQVVVSGANSIFSAVGQPGATITAQSASYPYAFSVQSGGRIAASYATFNRMNANGINIPGGAFVDPPYFQNCTFQNGAAAPSAMLTIENNQTLDNMRYLNFDGSGDKNIRKTLNQGYIRVRGGSGLRWGESYEQDPNNLIDWGGEHDVRVSHIIVPAGSLDSGVLIAPRCSVENLGLVTEPSYQVRMKIGSFYDEMVTVTNHEADTRQEVVFPARSDWPRGFGYAVSCSTRLTGDQFPSNDRMTGTVDVHVHDAAAEAFGLPANGGSILPGTVLNPTGVVRNTSFSNVPTDIPATLVFGTGPTPYSGSGTATNVAVGATATVNFEATPPLAAGYYTMTLSTAHVPDVVPENNTLSGEFLVMAAASGLSPDNDSFNYRNIALSWSPVAQADSYRVEVDNNSDFASPEFVASGITSTGVTTSALLDGHYYWRVCGVGHNILGPWASSQFDLDATPPVAPTLVQPAPGATNVSRIPTFEWTEVTFKSKDRLATTQPLGTDLVVHYDLTLARDPAFSDIVFSVQTSGLTYVCPVQLDYATDYWWRVRGTDNFGNIGAWGSGNFRTIGTAAPVLVEPVPNARLNDATPYFDWLPAVDADYYQLQVSLYPDFHETSIDIETDATDFTPVAALGDGHYYWHVRSSANGGVSYGDWSATREFDLDATPPAAPALIYPGNNATNIPVWLTFDWSDVSLLGKSKPAGNQGQQDVIDYYDIQLATDRNFTNLVFSTSIPTSQYTPVNPLQYSTRYWWRVRGIDDFENVGQWARDSFTTTVTVPGAPVLISPTNGANYVAVNGNLVWYSAVGAAEYDIYLDVVNPPVRLLAEHVTDTTVAYADLPPGTLHYWRVVARNPGGTTPSEVWSFTTGAALPPGWTARRDTLTGTAVKDGGGLVCDPDGRQLYALKGNKTFEFWRYTPAESTWTTMPLVPPGPNLKQVSKGAAITYGNGYVYVMKGNGTTEFYRFNTTTRDWESALRSIPLEPTQRMTKGKPVKAGGGLAYVNKQDTAEYVYVLKGTSTEFYKYDIVRDTFYTLDAAPYNTKAKYDKGSWIVYDGSRYIYAMQAKYNALFRYDVVGEQWVTTPALSQMPFVGRSRKSKKVGDGSAATWDGRAIYAFKGNNTQEFWTYRPGADGDTWVELETIPQAYAEGKKKKVKAGAALAFYPETGVIYALKGNKSNQFWVYTPSATLAWTPRPSREGVSVEATSQNSRSALAIVPNPLTGNQAVVRYSLSRPGMVSLSVCDVTGRVVMTRAFAAGRTGAQNLDLRELAAGVYLVKLDADGFSSSQKLVVER